MSIFDATNNTLTIQQGATFSLSLNFETADEETIDLSSATAAVQGRSSYASGSTLFSLTNLSGITLASTNPNIILTMNNTVTAALTAPLTGVYDIEVTISGTVYRILEGPLRITPEVTR